MPKLYELTQDQLEALPKAQQQALWVELLEFWSTPVLQTEHQKDHDEDRNGDFR